MPSWVIDTNVLVVADDPDNHAGPDCARLASAFLDTEARQGICLDHDGQMVNEYLRNVDLDNQRTVGALFLVWVLNNQWNPAKCRRVPLQTDPEGLPIDFPTDERLSRFDSDDRKFATTALIAGVPVVNALDADWWEYREELEDVGILLRFLCPFAFE